MGHKKRVAATPIDDTPISKHGDRYILVCVKDDEPDRYIEVDLGGVEGLREISEGARRWLRRVPS